MADVAEQISKLSSADDLVAMQAAHELAKIASIEALIALELTPARDNYHDPLGSVSEAFAASAKIIRKKLNKKQLLDDYTRLSDHLLHEHKSVAHRCREALANAGLAVVPILEDRISGGNEHLRTILVDLLGTIGQRNNTHQRVVQTLLNALQDPAAPVRTAALLGLRYHTDPRVAPAVIASVDDKNPRVQLQALLCLDFNKITTAVEYLASIRNEMAEENKDTWHKVYSILLERVDNI